MAIRSAIGPGVERGTNSWSLTYAGTDAAEKRWDFTAFNVRAYGAKPGTYSVSSITRSGSTATVTLNNHGAVTGDEVTISGANESDYNILATVTVVDANTFTYTVGGTPATPATGTITAVWDSYTAIQNAINAAQTAGGGSVFVPQGTYWISKPLRISNDFVWLKGEGRDLSIIRFGNGRSGPILHIFTAWTSGGVPTTTGILGSGNSMVFNSAAQYWLDLRPASPVVADLNGKTALTVELHYKTPGTLTASNRNLIASHGNLGLGDNAQSAFQIYTNDNDVIATIKTSAGAQTLTATDVLAVNTVYHLALAWDGTTARLYVTPDSTTSAAVDASVSLSGTLVQRAYEQIFLGSTRTYTPADFISEGALMSMADGTVDNVRISDSARYTANPATVSHSKYGTNGDTNQLVLLLFDDQSTVSSMTRIWYQGQISPGKYGYIPLVRQETPVDAVDWVKVSDIQFHPNSSGEGVYNWKSQHVEFEGVKFVSGNYSGLYNQSVVYTDLKRTHFPQDGTRHHLIVCGDSRWFTGDDVWVEGGVYPVILAESDIYINKLRAAASTATIWTSVFRSRNTGYNINIDNGNWTNELGTPGTFQRHVAAATLGTFSVNGGGIEGVDASATHYAPVYLYNCESVTLNNIQTKSDAGTPYVVEMYEPRKVITLIGMDRDRATRLTNDYNHTCIPDAGWFPAKRVTTTYSITATDCIIHGDATGAGFTATLPDGGAVTNIGKWFTIVHTGTANTLTVGTTSSQVFEYAVEKITASGTTATVTLRGHNYATSDLITITGAVESNYNGTFSITVTGADTFTYTMGGSPSSPATGPIFAKGRITYTLSAGSMVTVKSDGTDWQIMDHN